MSSQWVRKGGREIVIGGVVIGHATVEEPFDGSAPMQIASVYIDNRFTKKHLPLISYVENLTTSSKESERVTSSTIPSLEWAKGEDGDGSRVCPACHLRVTAGPDERLKHRHWHMALESRINLAKGSG